MGNSLQKVAPASPTERGAAPERRLVRRHTDRRQQARPEAVRSAKNPGRSRSHNSSASDALPTAAPLSAQREGGGTTPCVGDWAEPDAFFSLPSKANSSFRRRHSRSNIPIAAPISPNGCMLPAQIDGDRHAASPPASPGPPGHGIPSPSPTNGGHWRWHPSRLETSGTGQRSVTPRGSPSPSAIDAGTRNRAAFLGGRQASGRRGLEFRSISDKQMTPPGCGGARSRQTESKKVASEPSHLTGEKWAAGKSPLMDRSPRGLSRGSSCGAATGAAMMKDALQVKKTETGNRSRAGTPTRDADQGGGRKTGSRPGKAGGSQAGGDGMEKAASLSTAMGRGVAPRALRRGARGKKVQVKDGEKYGWLFPYPTPRLGSRYVPTGVMLGKGNFGEVKVFRSVNSGTAVASKRIGKEKLECVEDFEDVRREVAILRHLAGHPNVCELRGVYEDRESVHIVMGLCEGGALSSQILQRKKFPEREAAHLFCQVAEAVRHTHAHGVVHRDLKPENVFLSALTDPERPTSTQAVLGDYGLALFLRPGQLASGIAGSPYYFAPEVVSGHEYGREADIWSLGVILYVLISGMLPFYGNSDEEIFDRILAGNPRMTGRKWAHVSSAAKNLILLMLSMDAKWRPSAKEVLEHEWLSSMRESGINE